MKGNAKEWMYFIKSWRGKTFPFFFYRPNVSRKCQVILFIIILYGNRVSHCHIGHSHFHCGKESKQVDSSSGQVDQGLTHYFLALAPQILQGGKKGKKQKLLATSIFYFS